MCGRIHYKYHYKYHHKYQPKKSPQIGQIYYWKSPHLHYTFTTTPPQLYSRKHHNLTWISLQLDHHNLWCFLWCFRLGEIHHIYFSQCGVLVQPKAIHSLSCLLGAGKGLTLLLMLKFEWHPNLPTAYSWAHTECRPTGATLLLAESKVVWLMLIALIRRRKCACHVWELKGVEQSIRCYLPNSPSKWHRRSQA